MTLVKVEDKPGVAARIFGPLAENSINVDMIIQNVSDDGKSTDMTFTVLDWNTREARPRQALPRRALLENYEQSWY